MTVSKIIQKAIWHLIATIRKIHYWPLGIGDQVLWLDRKNEHELGYLRGTGAFDDSIAKACLSENMRVLDVGANIGYTALTYIKHGAQRVDAFEPCRKVFKRLKLLSGNKIRCFNLALSNEKKYGILFLSRTHDQGHSLCASWPKIWPSVFGEDVKKQKVKCETLDNLYPSDTFDFIKIDAEGSELDIVNGGIRFFENNEKAILQIEIYDEMYAATHVALSKHFKYCHQLGFVKSFENVVGFNKRDVSFASDYVNVHPPIYLYSNTRVEGIPLINNILSLSKEYLFNEPLKGDVALRKMLSDYEFETVLDVGSGSGEHADVFLRMGKKVDAVDFGTSPYFQERPSNYNYVQADYMLYKPACQFDAVWVCHVLEHQINVNMFLKKIHADLKEDGVLAITVPPLKHEIVGGHVTLWNAGLLLYNLVLAGFDCSFASVCTYGYNISVIVKKVSIASFPSLCFDKGDIHVLQPFFPAGLEEPFDGQISILNW